MVHWTYIDRLVRYVLTVGNTLLHRLIPPYSDQLDPPTRDLTLPFRLPISNVFKGQSTGIAVSSRVCGGVVQVGERVRVLPGDETAIIKSTPR